MTTQSIELRHTFDEKVYGKRLDLALSETFEEYSRSRIQDWVKQGFVKVNDEVITSNKHKMAGFELVEVNAEVEVAGDWEAEAIELNIVYEDDDLLVVNKPTGLVVHPGAGNQQGTMVNALLHHVPELQNLPRAGIIHRLDKETTGLLVVAKTIGAHTSLVDQLQKREFTREYDALVNRVMVSGNSIDVPIGRHPTKRTAMAVIPDGRRAITHFRVAEKFLDHTHLKLRLETGRTHQIRVHMSYLKFPIVGDPLYSGRYRVPNRITPELKEILGKFKRQALHASLLGLKHPTTGDYIEWTAPMPADMQKLRDALVANREHFSNLEE
ncbi:23S rRNA pseudouridine(1911/1915/1917) synthase RluD [Kangiella spongicola]|uniref:Pseudouridine synthase n=1 Tax=Kangiella spongicola TaxID=796379 RepID=A0A318D8G4_9GAMM|nr:23S rRNA pseudouridine(1911/1915/1917) synthase RluD [Kangiella spongicola]PXF62409.1 23S rRNA pseudouridine(1911/1915/1917) synthase RluD [Kangiella spongicola]